MFQENNKNKENIKNLQNHTDEETKQIYLTENEQKRHVLFKDMDSEDDHGSFLYKSYIDRSYSNIDECYLKRTETDQISHDNSNIPQYRTYDTDIDLKSNKNQKKCNITQNRSNITDNCFNSAQYYTQNDNKMNRYTQDMPTSHLHRSDLNIDREKEKLSEQDLKTHYFVKYNADKELSRDITIDLLTYLVAYKLINKPGKKRMEKPKKYKYVSIIVLICICLGVCFFMFQKNENNNEMYKIVNDPTVFGPINYFGKENVMETMIGRITRMIALIERNDKKLLGSKITASKKNFLFYGEPGTGKTHFIKKFAFLLDQNLKLYEMRKKKINIRNNDRKELLDEMKKIKPQVRLISIQPSSLNDKYVGGTEKNIHKLWEHAKNDKNFAMTIIFMDEIDSFFAKRKEENSEHSTNVKSEFLCILDGVRSDLSDRIMFIGATNMPKSLDEAFLRRFHTKICFQKPSPDERRQLIESFMIYNEIRFTESEIQKIVDASKDLSQSQISRIFSDAADLSDELTYSADINDIQILLQNIRNAGNNAEAELAEINITMRGTEYGYVFLNTFSQS